jgi:polyisoprenyl-teichoic acid--peptidoglycan teichoic acid transferase
VTDPQERPPRVGLGLVKRALLAAVLVVTASATAVAGAVIIEVDQIIAEFTPPGRERIEIPEITAADAGGARTIMVLGSDQRWGDRKLKLKPRSDTILLVRADPEKGAIAVMSIPRDLQVEIAGRGKAKINEAFELGGPRLAVRTVKSLFEQASGENFAINNVMVVDFGGFQRAVNYIGGVYVDVDRDYFNDNSSGGNFATIDVDPGYQKLRGKDALDYVRYRHGDNDFVRAARQQDFLRQARSMAGVRRLLSVDDRHKLARVFGRYFELDTSFNSRKEVFSMLRLALFLSQKKVSVNEVRFRASEAENPAVDTNLYASSNQLEETLDEFMNAKASRTPRRSSQPTKEDREFERVRKKRKRAKAPVKGLEDARQEGRGQAVLADPKLDFPFYFPALRKTGSVYAGQEPRVYSLKDELGKRHQAYRLVLRAPGVGEYYGVQAMEWRDPPILDDPDRTVNRNGRRLRLYYDGSKLRIVAWRTRRAVYWISNTLTQSLSSSEMLGIADSLQRLKQ